MRIKRNTKAFIKIVIAFSIIMILWLLYSTLPSPINNNLAYTSELASSYQCMLLQQFSCTRIECDQNEAIVITFDLKTRPGRKFSIFQFSTDECIDDIIKIRDETSSFLKNNPENELSTKKIHLIFNTYADEKMHLFNYNFQDSSATNEGFNFCYYNNLEVHDISKLKDLSNAKTLVFSTDVHYDVTDMSVFDCFHSLEVLHCPKYFSVEAINYLAIKFPNCEVSQ